VWLKKIEGKERATKEGHEKENPEGEKGNKRLDDVEARFS